MFYGYICEFFGTLLIPVLHFSNELFSLFICKRSSPFKELNLLPHVLQISPLNYLWHRHIICRKLSNKYSGNINKAIFIVALLAETKARIHINMMSRGPMV